MDEMELVSAAGAGEEDGGAKRLRVAGGSVPALKALEGRGVSVTPALVTKLVEWVEILLKSQLSSAQQLRVLRSAVLDIYMCPQEAVPVVQHKEATVSWHKAAEKVVAEERQEKLSSPHAMAWNRICKAALAESDGEQRKALEAYTAYVRTNGGWKAFEREIKVCRLAKAWDSKTFIKMEISTMDGSETQKILRMLSDTFFKKHKMRKLEGIAAPGQMEKIMQEYLAEAHKNLGKSTSETR